MHKPEYNRQLFSNFINLKKNMIGLIEHMEILKVQMSCISKLKDELHQNDNQRYEEHFVKILDDKIGYDCMNQVEKRWSRLKESLLLMEKQFQGILDYNKLLEVSVGS